MFVVLVEFVANAGQSEALHNRLIQQARDSLSAEENCLQFDVCRDPDDENHFVLYEVYRQEEDFHAHMATAHYATFSDDSAPMVAAKAPMILNRSYPERDKA